MIALLNGRFLPEEQALISVLDRGFLYGDGVFETIRVHAAHPFRWGQHLERLLRGAAFLRLRVPCTAEQLRAFADELIRINRLSQGLIRVTLSRGVGQRGYSPQGANTPTLVMVPFPEVSAAGGTRPRWRLRTSTCRVAAPDPLAGFNTSNKLRQVLARAEAEDSGADDGLLLTAEGHVAETTSANVFWVLNGAVSTTPSSAGVLPGVTRAAVLELCSALGIPTSEDLITLEALREADGVFVTLASLGVVEVVELDGQPLRQSPLTTQMRQAYEAALERECRPTGPPAPSTAPPG